MSTHRALEGLVVDPVEGAFSGRVSIAHGRVAAVERLEDGPDAPLIFPGFIDLQVYAPDGVSAHGVTGYLLATREIVQPEDDLCLGLHLEGPFVNPEAAGALPVAELMPVDLHALDDWLASGLVRVMTISPELPAACEAIALVAGRGAVAAIGHTHASARTVSAAIDAGARFATHLWNAMAPVRARGTGPVPELLLDDRVVLGLIADGRHLHPRTEELTVRLAGPGRIALTSDLVPLPAQRADGSLLGGDRCGAALVARFHRFGLAEAAAMASLVPARVLGLSDRGRIAPGYRADLALLTKRFAPLETLVGGLKV